MKRAAVSLSKFQWINLVACEKRHVAVNDLCKYRSLPSTVAFMLCNVVVDDRCH